MYEVLKRIVESGLLESILEVFKDIIKWEVVRLFLFLVRVVDVGVGIVIFI